MMILLRIVIVLLLSSTTYWVGRVAIAQSKEYPAYGLSSLPAIPFMEVLALGYREAAADLCWMQAVQYYGEYRQGENDLAHFSHFMDAVNTLDPRFEHAYWFGSTVMATDAQDLDAALEILRRGIRSNPGRSLLPFHAGFLAYAVAGDLEMSTTYFGYASTFPDCRDRALRFQAFVNSKLGHLEKSYALWDYLRKTATDDGVRAVAAANLKILTARINQQESAPQNLQRQDATENQENPKTGT